MNQLKKILLFLLFISSNSHIFAQQNLVPNHSFEDADSCNDYLNFQVLNYWFSPTDGTPDLYNACINEFYNYSTPINLVGYQIPQEGNAYVGIVVYGDGYDYREYLATELKETLKKDLFYKVEYYVNLSNFSCFYSNNFGIGFGKDSCIIPYTYQIHPTISISDKRMISDTANWEKRSLFYKARGDEKFVFFGNFEPDHTTTAVRNTNPYFQQFVLIDNVSVVSFDLQIENVFTPDGDNINDRAFFYPNITDVRCDVFNRWGERIKQVDLSKGWDGTDEHGKELPEGTYFYQLIGEIQQLIIASGFIQLIE
jgi:gliding motility-associated-like protein